METKNTLERILEEIQNKKRSDKWGDKDGEWAGCCGEEEIVGYNQALSEVESLLLKEIESLQQ